MDLFQNKRESEVMNGVIILDSYEYQTNQSIIIFFMCLCICFIIASITVLYVILKELKDKPTFWKEFALLFIICVALSIISGVLIPEDKHETRYQVTVDDSVTMSEFQSKYEIIEVEGKIYTVRDRVE